MPEENVEIVRDQFAATNEGDFRKAWTGLSSRHPRPTATGDHQGQP
jgi:hypothetical protein